MSRDTVIAPRGFGGPNVPLLMYPGLAAQERGSDVHLLEWNGDTPAVEQARPLVASLTRPLLIGSSKGTRLAALATEFALPAIWITPVLHAIAEDLENSTAPYLLIGGTADDRYWDGDLARALTPHVLEIEGADHALILPGPLAASAVVLGTVVTRIEQFMDEFAWPLA